MSQNSFQAKSSTLSPRRKKIVVLISGRGSNLQAINSAILNKPLNADIVAVISNEPKAKGLVWAKDNNICTLIINHRGYIERESYDRALIQAINPYDPDIVVLAGFMRKLTSSFIESFWPKIVNIHPSLLPKYPGLNTHQRALDAGDNEHGVSVHLVNKELDAGPLLAQSKIMINEDDAADSLAARLLAYEHKLYPQVISWMVEDRISVSDGEVYFDGKKLMQPIQVD